MGAKRTLFILAATGASLAAFNACSRRRHHKMPEAETGPAPVWHHHRNGSPVLQNALKEVP